MTFAQIINLAKEMARIKGTISIPGRYTESTSGEVGVQYMRSLYQLWTDDSVPRLTVIEGSIIAVTDWIDLPGYMKWVFVSLNDIPLGSLPLEHIYYNATENYSVDIEGFVIRDKKIHFTGDDVEVGNDYKIVFYSENPFASVDSSPWIPDKFHLHFVKELAFLFREDFGGDALTGNEERHREINRRKFMALVGGRTTESDLPVQYDPFWTS